MRDPFAQPSGIKNAPYERIHYQKGSHRNSKKQVKFLVLADNKLLLIDFEEVWQDRRVDNKL